MHHLSTPTAHGALETGWLHRLGTIPAGRQRVLLLLLCLLLYVVWPLRVPLTEVDETRFSEATRVMVAEGEYVIPSFNAAPRYQKPILYYWLQAAAIRGLGVTESAARLPSAIAVTLLVLLLLGVLRHWLTAGVTDERVRARRHGAAFLGAISLATTPLIAIWARAAVTDATLTLFITGAALALFQAETGHARRWYLVAVALAALAFLTKGPIGVVIPGGLWLAYHGVQRTLRAEARRVPWLAAVGLFLLIAAPWYVATYFVDGPGFLTHFFLAENIDRFASSSMEGHGFRSRVLGLFTYLPVILLLAFPWSAVLVRDLLVPGGGAAPLPRLRRFAWVWLAVVIGLFSLSRTQLPSYIQSITPAVAILVALHVLGEGEATASSSARRRRWAQGITLGLLLVFGLLWAGGVLYVLAAPSALDGPLGARPLAHAVTTPLIALLGVVGLSFLLITLLAGIRGQAETLVRRVLVGWVCLLATIVLACAPYIVRSTYGPCMAIGTLIRHRPRQERALTFYHRTAESLVYYARRPVAFHAQDDPAFAPDLRAALTTAGSAVIVTDAAGLPALRRLADITALYAEGDVLLVQARAKR